MEIQSSIAALQYAATRPATSAAPGDAVQGNGLTKLATDFASTLQNGEQVALDAMTGRADPNSLVQALAQTELAVETAVTVRNKVVEAYQEILRMPV